MTTKIVKILKFRKIELRGFSNNQLVKQLRTSKVIMLN